jgi:hypothetical protein
MVVTDLLINVAIATAIGLLLSLLLEQCVLPRPAFPWHRSFASLMMHCGIWIALCGFTLLVWRRPYFMMFNALAMQAVVVGVSVVKFRTLREPFIVADFEYFTDVLRHPRLYLPFFGVGLAALCVTAYGAVVVLGLYLETNLVALHGIAVYVLGLAMLAFGMCMAWIAGRMPVSVTLDAGRDMHQLGLFTSLWHYGRLSRQPVDAIKASSTFASLRAEQGAPSILPDLVVVQSESFFDVRRQYAQIHPDVLSTFDALKQQARLSGRLQVPAWGANTLRTEFGFLSGMDEAALGVHQYQPYRTLVRQGFPTIASYLKSLGYRTVCIHPYPASFYARDKVYPQLGFDAFLDIKAFDGAQYAGQYVSDMAVADLIRKTLSAPRDTPLFVFAITMENHGPLHWDKTGSDDDVTLLRAPVAQEHKDLISYARHLANADQMFGSVAQTLREQIRPGALCVYGDHVPIMAQVYKDLGTPDGLTDYLCWTTGSEAPVREQDLSVEQLAMHFLSVANVTQAGVLQQHFRESAA